MRRDFTLSAPGRQVNATTSRASNAIFQFLGFGVFLLLKTYLFYLVLVSNFIEYLGASPFLSKEIY